ncbi:MAG TPA: transglycosylase SLT domain-containing protein [Candidatus Paceibacterota bacterium]
MKEWFSGRPKRNEPEAPEFWWDETNKVFRRVYDGAEDIPVPAASDEYEVVEETRYGPVLRRRIEDVPVDVPNYSKPRAPEHPESELREPRTMPISKYEALRTVYREPVEAEFEEFREDDEEEEPDKGRRGFLAGLGALGATAALGAVAAENTKKSSSLPEKAQVTHAEEIDRTREAPFFDEEVEGYEKFAELKYNEVLFVDERNRLIGGPIELEDFVIMRQEDNGETKPYLVSPGPTDELGILTGGGIAGEWLAEMRIKLKEKYPHINVDLKTGKPRVLSINGKFHSSLYNSGDPEIVAAIADGQIKSYIDIVNHYALRKTPETDGLTVREYIEENIAFKPNVPPAVAEELRRLIPGLCAQESNFNNESVSRSGARGMFQFMPATWGDYAPEGETIEKGVASLARQVENAGAFFSDLYLQVQHHAGEATIEKLRTLYGEEVLQRDILVPLIINAYNAGGALMGEALRMYVERNDIAHRMPPAKDLFISIANFARDSEEGKYLSRYGDEARQYVTRIYANANVLHA